MTFDCSLSDQRHSSLGTSCLEALFEMRPRALFFSPYMSGKIILAKTQDAEPRFAGCELVKLVRSLPASLCPAPGQVARIFLLCYIFSYMISHPIPHLSKRSWL